MNLQVIKFTLIVAIITKNEIVLGKTEFNQSMEIEEYKDYLKTEYGCTPPHEWQLVKQNADGAYVRDVCISSSYQIFDPPSMEVLTEVLIVVTEKQIVEIDEITNSLTILVGMYSIWEDPRVRVKQFSFGKPITLPPLYTNNRYIWTPFTIPRIEYVKELTFIHNPVMAQILLVPGKAMNAMLLQDIYDPNATLIISLITWKVKISCNFDFSKFPFDRQSCPLEMEASDINVTMFSEEDNIRTNQSTYGGYSLKQEILHSTSDEFFAFNEHTTTFGFYNNLTRQIEPYIYQYYMPCTTVVLTSFFSFLIPLTAIPGRVAILVTQFLTLTSIFIHAMVC